MVACILIAFGALVLGAALMLLTLWLAVRRFTLKVYRGPQRARKSITR